MWKMVMDTKGKIIGLLLLATLPAFIAGGAWMFVEGLQKGLINQAIMGFIAMAFFGAGTILFAPSIKYVPGKTFSMYIPACNCVRLKTGRSTPA